VQTSADNGKTWQDAVVSTKAIRIVIPNLVPGASYLVRARAIGGSTGASNWTSPAPSCPREMVGTSCCSSVAARQRGPTSPHLTGIFPGIGRLAGFLERFHRRPPVLAFCAASSPHKKILRQTGLCC
jgi:hypothetical protein